MIMANKCKNCGAVVSDTAKFCTECGTKIERELKCANCGAVLAANAKFCMECGTKVGEVNTSSFNKVDDNDSFTDIYNPNELVNTILPYSKFDDKTPDGVIVASTELDVTYQLTYNPVVLAEIAKKVEKYNKRAVKKGYFTIVFDMDKRLFNGKYYPQLETPDMSYFKKVMIAGDNADLCGDFLRICKLCETIMIR